MSRLLDLFYPKRCVLCGRILPWGQKEQHCSFCDPEKWLLKGPRCRLCSRPVAEEGGICRSCLVHSASVSGFSLLRYEGLVRDSIHRFKYEGQKDYAGEYADWIVRYAGAALHNAVLLVPIPVHRRRRLERGYNQAEELAKEISRRSAVPYGNLLLRVRETAPQNALTARGRKMNVAGAFALAKQSASRGDIRLGDIVLLDDIYTSGSTVEEAGAVIKAAYPDHTVRFLTLAMAMEEKEDGDLLEPRAVVSSG